MTEEKKDENNKVNIDEQNWNAILRGKGEIKLNFKWTMLVILVFSLCIFIGLFVGSIQGYLWTLKPNLIWTIILSLFSIIFLVGGIIIGNIRAIIFFLLTSIFFIISIFHPLFK